jgi:hypothetical protein
VLEIGYHAEEVSVDASDFLIVRTLLVDEEQILALVFGDAVPSGSSPVSRRYGIHYYRQIRRPSRQLGVHSESWGDGLDSPLHLLVD